ncbi:MAG: L,D-transpeptidase family protein [Candidatus Omnitrophica bacterium]|nr:L,D-transpeptidase family protein [Candidatus Omnitrophota bacterium]
MTPPMNAKRWRLILGTVGVILVAGMGLASRRSASVRAEASSANGLAAKKEPDVGAARILLARAETARVQGSLLEAKQLYQQVLLNDTDSAVAATVQQRLGEVNLKLILSPVLTPDATAYVVQPGDTLSKIARQFHTTVELLKASNGLESDRIRPDHRLKVVKANFSVIVDKSQNTLTLKNGEEVLKVYRCSTGKGGITPPGRFKITSRIMDPPWYTPNGVIPHGDPRNVLGSRWLGFDLPGYGIHGTTEPESIGKSVTKGCVRLVNADAEELFALLPEGTSVTIVE